MRKRKSKSCPSYCDGKGCFDSYEPRTIDGKKFKVWVIHCKELEKISERALNLINGAKID